MTSLGTLQTYSVASLAETSPETVHLYFQLFTHAVAIFITLFHEIQIVMFVFLCDNPCCVDKFDSVFVDLIPNGLLLNTVLFSHFCSWNNR